MWMTLWTEFRGHVLPWLIAAGFVALAQHNQSQHVQQLEAANVRLAASVDEMRQAVGRAADLLATQGYTVPLETPPTSKGSESR
uniref:Uncharacterized protein n=1 Tax=viral metagenome TaxID=1070528 RepID=A0A6M3LV12_9ZZZZ